MAMYATYRGVKVKVSFNPFHQVFVQDEAKALFKQPELIGLVHDQKDKDSIIKWVAYDEKRESMTFASTRNQAIYQLIDKLNEKFVFANSFHSNEEGLTDMRESIKQVEALYMLQSKQATGVGFMKAHIASEPKREPLEDGWFDLNDEDINLLIRQDGISLELWFNGLYSGVQLNLGERTIKVEDVGFSRTVQQVKLKVTIFHEDLEYIKVDGKRLMIQK
jgi:hypothetical protein